MEVDRAGTHGSLVHRTVSEIQRFIGECLDIRPHRQIERLAALLRGFPVSSEPQHERILRGLLMEFSIEWSERVHRRLHDVVRSDSPDPCPFKPAEFSVSVWRGAKRRPPFDAVRAWGEGMRTQIELQHPEINAMRLRDRIDANFSLPLASIVKTIAADAGAAARLRMHFHRIAGCSAHVYLTRRRVLAAQELLVTTTEKMETIAREVGWKSPKDFYRAIFNATGQTPAELREHAARYDLESRVSLAHPSGEKTLMTLTLASALLHLA